MPLYNSVTQNRVNIYLKMQISLRSQNQNIYYYLYNSFYQNRKCWTALSSSFLVHLQKDASTVALFGQVLSTFKYNLDLITADILLYCDIQKDNVLMLNGKHDPFQEKMATCIGLKLELPNYFCPSVLKSDIQVPFLVKVNSVIWTKFPSTNNRKIGQNIKDLC